MVSIGQIFFWVLRFILFIVAVVLAYNINCPGKRFWPMLGAILFPEIYLIQYVVRRYLIEEPGYGIPGKCRVLIKSTQEPYYYYYNIE
jgi:hypothetical protein